jgi:hypothetical protein
MVHPLRSFAEMRERLVNAINKANLRINAEYILEDLDVVVAFAEAMLGEDHMITKEAQEWYQYFWGKYGTNLTQHVEEIEARRFAMRAETWLNYIRQI